MKKSPKAGSATAAAIQSSPAPSGAFAVVKAIKNSLFKGVPVGGSVKIAGVIQATELDEGNFGTFTRFLGKFRAKVGETVFMAGELYVPGVAESLLIQAFDAQVDKFLRDNPALKPAESDSEEESAAKRSKYLKAFSGVEFGIFLEKVEDKSPNNANGFQWVVKPLLDTAPPEDKYLKLVAGS
jgi:hypothetical protein